LTIISNDFQECKHYFQKIKNISFFSIILEKLLILLYIYDNIIMHNYVQKNGE